MNLKTKKVYYTQAFSQADLPDPVFMRVPQGWFYDLAKTLNTTIHHSTLDYAQTCMAVNKLSKTDSIT
jgi:hypothetical protein